MAINITGRCEVCLTEFVYIKSKPSRPDILACSKACSYKLRKMTRNVIHDPIEKTCLDCKAAFLDTSKKKLVDRCRKCVNAGMVETRRLKGSYVRSESQNKKLSETMHKKYEEKSTRKKHLEKLKEEQRQIVKERKVCLTEQKLLAVAEQKDFLAEHKRLDNSNRVKKNSNKIELNGPEHKRILSEGMKRRWADGSMRAQSVKASMEKWGVPHWTQSDVGRKFSSEKHKGRKFSDEQRKNMSLSAARRIRENNNHNERGNGGYREDLGHYVRSNWEANFARILIYQGKTYEYESKTFVLSACKSYTPDFLVDGVFYEIKGYWTELARQKMESFRKQYPDTEMQIIEGTEYSKLRLQYRDVILWEGK